MTDRESKLIERLIQGYQKDLQEYIQGIVLSEEQNRFIDRLISKEELRNKLNHNDEMNLQELLKERERIDNELKRYEAEMQKRHELIEWKERFGAACELPSLPNFGGQIATIALPKHIREIIVNALQAEIEKLEKE